MAGITFYQRQTMPLTWEDIREIVRSEHDLNPGNGYDLEHLLSEFQTEEGFYKEILKRFKDGKK